MPEIIRIGEIRTVLPPLGKTSIVAQGHKIPATGLRLKIDKALLVLHEAGYIRIVLVIDPRIFDRASSTPEVRKESESPMVADDREPVSQLSQDRNGGTDGDPAAAEIQTMPVMAEVVTGEAAAENEATARFQERRMLAAMIAMPRGSLAEWAKHLGWMLSARPGKLSQPNKSLAQRVMKRLVDSKYVKKEGRFYVLTPVGEESAKNGTELSGFRPPAKIIP